MEIHLDDAPSPDVPDNSDTTQPTPRNGGVKLCEVCGEEIPYRPGHKRGKWHEQCRPAAAQRQSSRTTNIDTLIGSIEQLHIAVGASMNFVPPIAMDGMVVTVNAHDLAESWRPLILKDANIRKFWERATTGTGWGKVIIAYGMVGMAIASNHGVTLPGMKSAVQS